MVDLADRSVGPTNMGELAVAGVSKFATERALQPFVGNANVYSGFTKLAIGVGTDSVAGDNTIGRGFALGVGIDGLEDLMTVAFNQVNTSKSSNLMSGMASSGGSSQVM